MISFTSSILETKYNREESMKKLLLILTLSLSANSIMAANFGDVEEVIEVISNNTVERTLYVDEDTFIPNVFGYGCPVPAIKIKYIWKRQQALNHSRPGGALDEGIALEIGDPRMRFCSHLTAEEIFGEDFKAGAEMKIDMTTKREILLVTSEDGSARKILRETISGELNGLDLVSVAELDLGPVK